MCLAFTSSDNRSPNSMLFTGKLADSERKAFEEAGKNRTVFHSYDIDVSDSEIGTLAKGDFSLKYLTTDNKTALGPSDETLIKDRFST